MIKTHDLTGNLEMFQMGDYFQIPDLSEEALTHVRASLAHLLEQDLQSSSAAADFPAFCAAVRDIVYSAGCHDDVFDFVAELCKVQLNHLIVTEDFQDLLRENPDLAIAILDKFARSSAAAARVEPTSAFDDLRLT